MKILLTGGTGFLGSAISRQLVDSAQHQLVMSVRSEMINVSSDYQTILVGDFRADTVWGSALSGVVVVIHSAARVHVMNDTSSDPLTEFRKVNVEGTLNLARQAAAEGVKRFIFISSIKVNGEKSEPEKPFSPDDTFIPTDPYGLSKYEAEKGLLALAKETGMEVVIIRPPLVYGPGVRANFLSVMKWIHRGVPLPFGAVCNKRSLVALDNLVSFIIYCADVQKTPQAANEVFLISDGEDVSTTELLRKVSKAMGSNTLLIPVPTWLMVFAARLIGKGGVADRLFGSLQIDSSKTRDLLGWQPVVSMDEQLAKTTSAFLESIDG